MEKSAETATQVLFDPGDPALRHDPYPVYRRLREQSPVWRSPDEVYYFSRYRDCFELFRNPALSYDTLATKAFRNSLSPDSVERARQLEQARRSRTVLDLDPPEHSRLRSVLSRAFAVRTVEASEPMIARFTDELLDSIEGPTIDLVRDFALLLPILVICKMLGVPPEQRDQFAAIGNAMVAAVEPGVSAEERNAASERMRDYIATLVAVRRDHPGDDLMSRLIEATEDGRLASRDELLSNTGLLLVAGFETTTNLITNAVYQLLRHPGQLAALTAEPALIRSAVEEVLRFDPPVHMMRARTITAEVTIGEAQLYPGDAVVMLLAAANRDPDEFENPETFDIRRTVNRHLGFGLGHHMCIGAALARMETRLAVTRIFERFPGLALAPGDAPELRPNLSIRGFARLPVTL